MSTNVSMVDLLWHDGTKRIVPEGTPYLTESGFVYFAWLGGCSTGAERKGDVREYTLHHTSAVQILAEAPEPPIRVEVPTGVGSLVSFSEFPYDPGFVLTSDGWYSLVSVEECDPDTIASLLRNGGRVLFEGRKR